MKTTLKMVAVVASMMIAAQAEAQLSALKQTGSAYAGAVTGAVAPGDVSQEAIVQSFVQANIAVLLAQGKFQEAFGNKKASAKANATAEALQSGSTEMDKDALKASFLVTDEIVVLTQDSVDSSVELSAEGREHYIEGLALAVVSVMSTKELAVAAKTFATTAQSEIKSSSMLQKPKLIKKFSAGMFVAKQLPGFTTKLTQNFGSLMTYAKSADIPTPDDATEAMAAL